MKVFHCDRCDALVFFENVGCMSCGHALAYFPDQEKVGSLDQARQHRPCETCARHEVCNWAVPADDPNPLCRSCRLTRVIPDLGQPAHKLAWFRLESAKRRLGREPFDRIAADWHALTYVLNNLNRSLGQADAYPFVVSAPALDKLRFVHDTIAAA